MRMLKSMAVAVFLTVTVACGGGSASHDASNASPSPTPGLVLDNDTSHTVTLRGCAGCGSGRQLPAGVRQAFDLPDNSSRVYLDESDRHTRCLTIMQGIASDKPTVIKVSEAGPC